jgi:hypothetical protein
MATIINPYRFAAAGGAFDPSTDLTWHSLWWADGTNFTGLYNDGDALDGGPGTKPWPNETAEADLYLLGTAATNDNPYDANDAEFNNQGAVAITSAPFITNASISQESWTVDPDYTSGVSTVVVGKLTEVASNNTLTDGGSLATERNVIRAKSNNWSIYAGTTIDTGGTPDTNVHLFTGIFDGSTGADKLIVDGTTVINTNAGSGQLKEFALGGTRAGANLGKPKIALCGVYEGDITADSEYSNFTDWVETYYGLTIS